MNHERLLCGVSVAHDRASIDQLEAATLESQAAGVDALLAEPGVSEAFVLQTCNRVEAYAVAGDASHAQEAVAALVSELPESVVRELDHEASLRHLFRVAAGLESLVLGEDQILGQVREAYEDARRMGGIGPVLENGVTKAIRVGERARTETGINEGVVSLASAAVRLAAERHGLSGATAAVVGTGEMGTLAAKRVAPHVDRLVLANRTASRAESLAARVEASTVETTTLEQLPETFDRADVVISATASSEYVVDVEALSRAGETFVIDITRPRDVPPEAATLNDVTVYDLDRLEAVTEKTRRRRRQAAREVEAIVDEEFERLLVQYKRQRADRVISAMYAGAERVKASELERALDELDLDEEQAETVESMADAIVSQLLAAPTRSLRDAAEVDDWSTIHTALQLFDPHVGPDDDPSPAFVAEMTDNETIPDRYSSGESVFEESDD